LLEQADALVGGAGLAWHDHRRAAKKRARKIQFTRGRSNRVQLYGQLIAITRASLAYLQQASKRLAVAGHPLITLWQAQLRHYRPLIERIINQSERRVLVAEAVPASEKLVSLFEPHADIIVKGSRDTEYGHKLNLTTGRSGMVLDLVIETGNPRDSDRLLPMLKRHIAFHGQAPRQAAADGGFASRDNLAKRRPGAFATWHSTDRRPQNRGHGPQPLGLPQAAQLPGRHRGRHRMPQTRLRLGALHLARPRPLQGLCLVFGGGLQPRAARTSEARLTAPGHYRLVCRHMPAPSHADNKTISRNLLRLKLEYSLFTAKPGLLACPYAIYIVDYGSTTYQIAGFWTETRLAAGGRWIRTTGSA
jgi:IS5 family transposase